LALHEVLELIFIFLVTAFGLKLTKLVDENNPGISTILVKSCHWLAAWYATFEPNGT